MAIKVKCICRLKGIRIKGVFRMDKEQNTGNILTEHGCKNTRSRKAVIGVLEHIDAPISAEDIYLRVKESGSSINLSTVYRILELMEDMKLASKTVMSDGKARYELTGDGHRHHLICTNCHKVVPIDVCPIEELQKNVIQKTNFNITGHRLELYGVCPECKKSK
jgi:Fur family transcriptional regulator, ferric uptake regulator